jgi:hypothetical protein
MYAACMLRRTANSYAFPRLRSGNGAPSGQLGERLWWIGSAATEPSSSTSTSPRRATSRRAPATTFRMFAPHQVHVHRLAGQGSVDDVGSSSMHGHSS